MKQQTGGIKRSSQLIFRRRLLLARLLLRGPMTVESLIGAVQADLGVDGYPTAAVAALKHDLHALKAAYGCKITFRPLAGGYVLEDLGILALLKGSAAAHAAIPALATWVAADPADAERAAIAAILEPLKLLAPEG